MVRTKEEKREYDKKWRERNREKERLRVKKYREENKEKERLRGKKYREENLEKEKLRNKKYRENNLEKLKARDKKYRENNLEIYHKGHTIYKWKSRGLIVDDDDEYESIYYLVMSTDECELCGCILTNGKPITATSRCMDHCHLTGKFRNVLCYSCNAKLPKQIINNTNINNGI